MILMVYREIKPVRTRTFKTNTNECPSGSSVIKCNSTDDCIYSWGPNAFCKNGVCYLKYDSCNEDQECLEMLEKK